MMKVIFGIHTNPCTLHVCCSRAARHTCMHAAAALIRMHSTCKTLPVAGILAAQLINYGTLRIPDW